MHINMEVFIVGRKPDYKSDGCAVWVNEDKNKNPYLTIKLVAHTPINVFKNMDGDKNG